MALVDRSDLNQNISNNYPAITRGQKVTFAVSLVALVVFIALSAGTSHLSGQVGTIKASTLTMILVGAILSMQALYAIGRIVARAYLIDLVRKAPVQQLPAPVGAAALNAANGRAASAEAAVAEKERQLEVQREVQRRQAEQHRQYVQGLVDSNQNLQKQLEIANGALKADPQLADAAALAEANQRAQQATAALSAKEQELARVQQAHVDSDRNVGRELEALKAEKLTLEQGLQRAQQEIRALEQRLAQQPLNNGPQNGNVQALEAELQAVRAELDRAQRAEAHARAQVSQLDHLRNELRDSLEEGHKQAKALAETKREITQLKQQLEQAKKKSAQNGQKQEEGNVAILRQKLQEAETKLETAEALQKADAEEVRKARELQETMAKKERESNKAEADLARERAELATALEQVEEERNKFAEIQEELASKKHDLNKMKQLKDDLEAAREAVKPIQLKNSQLQAQMNMLVDLLREHGTELPQGGAINLGEFQKLQQEIRKAKQQNA